MKVKTRLMSALVVAIAAILLSSPPAAAQSTLPSAEVMGLLGSWGLVLDGPMGPLNLSLDLTDQAGKVGAVVGASEFTAGKITDITKAGADLVLKFTIDAQGMTLGTKLTLTPDGPKVKAVWDIGDGQFSMPGAGTKK